MTLRVTISYPEYPPTKPAPIRNQDGHPNPAHRNESIRWAQRLTASNNWVILDTETTGLGDNDEIVQLAILAPDGTVLFDRLIKPMKKRMPAEAQKVHGITISMLKDAPTYDQCEPEIIRILSGKLVVVYNAEYDSRLLRQTRAKYGIVDSNHSMECAMIQYSQFVGQWAAWKNEYKWQKLPRGQRHAREKHGACGDCRLTLELIQTMAATPFAQEPASWWQFWKWFG